MQDILDKSKKASDFMKLLSNQNRLIVLCALVEKPVCVSDLLKITNSSQSALSQHLARMSKEGIIAGEKRGNQVFYTIKDPAVLNVIHVLHGIFCKEA